MDRYIEQGIREKLNQEEIAFLERRFSRLGGRIKKLHERLGVYREQSDVDGLTGVYNRRAFDRHINAAVLRACRMDHKGIEEPLILAMLDVDNFKKYNEGPEGHTGGDDADAYRDTKR